MRLRRPLPAVQGDTLHIVGVGDNRIGKVHPLAIKSIKERAMRKNLKNVVPVLSSGYPVNIDSHSADVIYALDMFHHIKDAMGFLKELHRLIKPNGTLFIESGHQPLNDAKQKIVKSDSCLSGYHPHPLYVVCLLGLQARAGAGALRRRSG